VVDFVSFHIPYGDPNLRKNSQSTLARNVKTERCNINESEMAFAYSLSTFGMFATSKADFQKLLRCRLDSPGGWQCPALDRVPGVEIEERICSVRKLCP
jgi:hypothetical protein